MSSMVLSEDIISFIDTDVQAQAILQSVYEDRGRYEQDINLQPMLALMAERLAEGRPFWELRCIVRWLVRRLQPQTYLEIGNRTGWSLLQAARENPAIQIVGFDMWMDNYANVSNSDPNYLRQLLKELGHSGAIQFISGDSHVTLPAFISGLHLVSADQQRFDMITVDGDHSHEGARADLELCAPLVKPGGVLIFDDLIHEQHGYLLDLWHEFASAHPEFVCVANTRDYPGTGIGFRLPLPAFLTQEGPAPAGARSIGARQIAPFGTLQEDSSRLVTLLGQLNELRIERYNQATVLERTRQELSQIKSERAAKEAVMQQIASDLHAVHADRSAKEAIIDHLAGDLELVRADQAAKEQVIARLATQTSEQASLLAAKDALVQQFSDELVQYRSLGWGMAHVALRGKRKLRRILHTTRERSAPARVARVPAAAVRRDPSTTHVALDVLQIQFGISGGVEVYMQTLVRALMSQGQRARVTLLCTPDQVPHLRSVFGDTVMYHVFEGEPAAMLVRSLQKIKREQPLPPAVNGANITFTQLGQQLDVDILHSPVQLFSSMDFMLPSVLNLHDLQHLHFPENFTPGDLEARELLYGRSAALASAIIASSEFVRRDIVERMHIPASKVHMIPVACNPDVERGLLTFSVEQARQHYHLPATFGFYPAQFWKHKNHARLIEALAIVRARAPQHDFKLVLSGYRGHSGWPEAEEAIRRLGLADQVLLLDFIPTEHLAAIYRAATFCVMPSLFEASSYPVIEAQTLGCPAMCSNVTSLPELMADGAGLLFDPFSPDDIAANMLRWLNDPADRQAHAERGQQRALHQHSLATYADRVLSVYERIRKV